jgi:hypothetical protein
LPQQHEDEGEENKAKAPKPKTYRHKPYANRRSITVSEARLKCLRVFWKPPTHMDDSAAEKLFMQDAWTILDKALQDTSVAKAAVHASSTGADDKRTYSAKDKEGDPRFKGFLDAPGKTKTIT